jgi:hypothetical protein
MNRQSASAAVTTDAQRLLLIHGVEPRVGASDPITVILFSFW